MKEEPYIEALKRAEEELAACEIAAHELDCKRAKLRQTITMLKSLVGIDTQREQESLTDAIRTVIKVTPGLSRCSEVVDQLKNMGYPDVHPRSVATILSRLAKNGQLLHDVTGYSYGGRAAVMARMREKRMKARKEK